MRTPYSTLNLTPGFGEGSGGFDDEDRGGVRSLDRRSNRRARRSAAREERQRQDMRK